MKRILIINNDFDTMELLKTWLQFKNYEVAYTGKAEEVNDLMKTFSPNLILIDVIHRDVAEMLIKEIKNHKTPLLMMTGYTITHQKHFLPGNDVIEKPLNLKLLLKKIEQLTKSVPLD